MAHDDGDDDNDDDGDDGDDKMKYRCCHNRR